MLLFRNVRLYCSIAEMNSIFAPSFGNVNHKHCQRHNRPKKLSTLTHSTPPVQSKSFNKHWKLGQTSAFFCSANGEKYKEQLWQIHVTTLTNASSNFENPCNTFTKSMHQFWKPRVLIFVPNGLFWSTVKPWRDGIVKFLRTLHKKQFIFFQFLESPIPPHYCSSVTKWSDSGMVKA